VSIASVVVRAQIALQVFGNLTARRHQALMRTPVWCC
jgi:hypothetical protein